MAYPRFVFDTHDLQFSRGLRYPVSKPKEKVQAIDRTANGRPVIETFGVDINTRVLTFKNLPLADYTALVDWFDTIANGAVNAFTYYDEDGVSMQVRILTPALDFQQTSYRKFSGELLLEVV